VAHTIFGSIICWGNQGINIGVDFEHLLFRCLKLFGAATCNDNSGRICFRKCKGNCLSEGRINTHIGSMRNGDKRTLPMPWLEPVTIRYFLSATTWAMQDLLMGIGRGESFW
jgi:hypothetical protein